MSSEREQTHVEAQKAYERGFTAGERQGIARAAQVADDDDEDILATSIRSLQSDEHWLEKHDAEVRAKALEAVLQMALNLKQR